MPPVDDMVWSVTDELRHVAKPDGRAHSSRCDAHFREDVTKSDDCTERGSDLAACTQRSLLATSHQSGESGKIISWWATFK